MVRRALVVVAAVVATAHAALWHQGWEEAQRQAIAAYKSIEASGGWPVLTGSKKLSPGDKNPAVETLRRHLAVTGDLQSDTAGDPDVYDDALRAAVIRFQRRHGLMADGVIGQSTRDALNVPVAERIAQLEAALAFRRTFVPPAARFLIVNVPSAHLEVIDKGYPVLLMRAAVGRPERPTPLLSGTRIKTVVFNPTWTMPRTIILEDMPRKIAANPSIFFEKGIRVYRGDEEIDPDSVDWNVLPKGAWGRYRFVQEAGSDNPLGGVKFLFPNKESVYLHDTSDRTIFRKPYRYFSSGCIRIEHPDALVALLLGESFTPPEEPDSYIPVKNPLPLAIVYWSAWVDEQGTVQFRPDVYGYDKLRRATIGKTGMPKVRYEEPHVY